MELTKDYILSLLPKRPNDANKGTFGKVMVVAGSKKYPGAAYLACAAAYRVGAGLVTLASIPFVCEFVIKKLPEVTLVHLSEENGAVSNLALDDLWENLQKFSEDDVFLLGPGLTKKPVLLIEEIFKLYDLPKLVIDGDGLNILSDMRFWEDKFSEHDIHAVITPHLREFSRLTKITVEKIQKDRFQLAKEFALSRGQVVVLKGANTIIVSPTGEVKVSPFINPALASAGTGDVLSGIIAGFLAQGLSTFDAACLGVYVHGSSGEILREDLGDAGVLASDILPILPKVIKSLK